MKYVHTVALTIVCGLAFTACLEVRKTAPDDKTVEEDPAEIQLGERPFLETRFSQFFYANSGGKVNVSLADGEYSH